MRDAILFVFILFLALRALTQPHIGIMLWTWLSIMNPHRLSWKLSTFPVAMMAAVVTFIGVLIAYKRCVFKMDRTLWLLLAFMLWTCITYPFSYDVDGSTEMLTRVLKIQIMLFVAAFVLNSRQHINLFVCVFTASVAFFGIKGGLFTILTGGAYRVWGPPESFISGNNEIALALVIAVPLVVYLAQLVQKSYLKLLIHGAAVLCAIAAVGSHSRGALVALLAMGTLLWWRGKKKFLFGVLAVGAVAALLAFMPEHWTDRMETIGTYKEDASALGRLNAWQMAFNLALDRPLGGGYAIYNPYIFSLYAPDPLAVHAAHSIYFQVLGEQGFIGLALYLALWISCWRDASWLRKQTRERDEYQWLARLASLSQVALVGFAVGGAFLSLAYFDLPFNILIALVVAKRWFAEDSQKSLSSDAVSVATIGQGSMAAENRHA